MTECFEFQIMDDPDHEDLVAEILYKGEFCFLITQESGFQNLDIQIQGRSSGRPWQFAVADMEQSIRQVKKRLWDLRRTES